MTALLSRLIQEIEKAHPQIAGKKLAYFIFGVGVETLLEFLEACRAQIPVETPRHELADYETTVEVAFELLVRLPAQGCRVGKRACQRRIWIGVPTRRLNHRDDLIRYRVALGWLVIGPGIAAQG